MHKIVHFHGDGLSVGNESPSRKNAPWFTTELAIITTEIAEVMAIFIIFFYEVALTNPDLAQTSHALIPQREILTAHVVGGDSAFFIVWGSWEPL
ncbi:hypothetical protein [Sodalis-like endosymbiont of Proechinophthirus fluctus]|uniref:hypothetical protein n=1 Tax=Sodalis-like endosymbiont of Proechinophthirus fluctus TaxID=1462730 RepID=UPI001FCBC5CB|nr:hypothetical protein [Sodalis-like endosymbiont of Proechinophthirus fluctus]